MLYLVLPNRQMRWSDLPGRTVIRAVRENGADLTGVEWDSAEAIADDNIVRLALRNGIVCSSGIAVDATDLVAARRPDQLRAAHEGVRASRANLKGSDALIEQLLPGSTELGHELDARVDESVRRSIEEAEWELAEDLAKPVDQTLVEHWRFLGGTIPEPA